MRGDRLAARTLLEEALAISRDLGDVRNTSISLLNLGIAARGCGDHSAERSLFAEALALRSRLGNRPGVVDALEEISRLASAKGDSRFAAQLLGAAERLREEIGQPRSPAARGWHAEDVAAASAALGEQTFAQARAEGMEMSWEEAVDSALRWIAGGGADSSSGQ